MISQTAFERCQNFIQCQLNPSRRPLVVPASQAGRMTVTLSRQAGSGAMVVAQKLADYLQAHLPGECPWTVFDKNLMDKVLEEHHLPTHLAKYLPEDRISEFSDMLDEFFGLHPSSWTVIRQTTETILHLTEVGHVILIGRGANIITSSMPNAFHVRLVAPLEKRIEVIAQRNHLGRPEAETFVHDADRARAGYLRKHFQKDIEDPLLYDLVINTDRFPLEEVARIIGEAVMKRAAACRAAAAVAA